MGAFTGKKLLLVGFITILLIGIPLTVFLLQQQQDNRSSAQKSTTLSFVPVSTETAPIQKTVGETFPLEINVNPGVNSVSSIQMEIQYDPTKLATAEANAFQPNTTIFPTIIEGPIYTPGKISVTLSIGFDITKAVTQPTRAATVNFKALTTTITAPTLITYGNTTKVTGVGSQEESSENVLSTTSPAYVSIASGSGDTTPVPSPSGGVTPLPTPIVNPDPTTPPAPTTTTPTGTASNQAPVCAYLKINEDVIGIAPYTVNFTVNGSDTDGTINKVTFNFGDGAVVDVTQAGGVGTNSISAQTSHTYTVAGTYQASAVLTDNSNGISTTTSCTQTITITGNGSTGSTGTTTGTSGSTGTTTTTTQTGGTSDLPAAGPGDMFLGAGAALGILSLIGGIIFFTF